MFLSASLSRSFSPSSVLRSCLCHTYSAPSSYHLSSSSYPHSSLPLPLHLPLPLPLSIHSFIHHANFASRASVPVSPITRPAVKHLENSHSLFFSPASSSPSPSSSSSRFFTSATTSFASSSLRGVGIIAVAVASFSLLFFSLSEKKEVMCCSLSSSPHPFPPSSSSASPSGPLPPPFLSALSALFGDRLSVSEDDCVDHSSDASSYHKGEWRTGAVVYPSSTEDVSRLMALCYAYRVPVIPYGSGTSLEGHTAPSSQGVITIDMSRMNNIIKLNENDLDCRVQAGITWNQLNDEISAHHLFFPVDPGPGASIGGMMGTSCSGTNACKYGTMKHNVLSCTAVLSDGTIIRTGGRARKSSAGYDLTRLLIGSEGTLAVITEISLKLQVIPSQVCVGVSQFSSLSAASLAAISIIRRGIPIGCMELLDSACINAVNQYSSFSYQLKPSLFFKFSGSEGSVADDIEKVSKIVREEGGTALVWAKEKEERERIWEARKGALWATMALDESKSVWTTDVCVPITALAESIRLTQEDIEREGIIAPIVGHVADGNYHVLMLIDANNQEEMMKAKRINHRMVQRAIQVGGTCTGEHGVGLGKKQYLSEELGSNTVNTMKIIKKALDPYNLMNPGKIFDL